MLTQAHKQKKDGILIEKPQNENCFDTDKEINVDPKTYCKLGHFHLLMEEYSKGMRSYLHFNFPSSLTFH